MDFYFHDFTTLNSASFFTQLIDATTTLFFRNFAKKLAKYERKFYILSLKFSFVGNPI